MKAILVDDDALSLDLLVNLCEQSPQIDIRGTFSDSKEALAFAKENPVELVLCDIEMPNLNGIELSVALRRIYPKVVIGFTTAHEDYVLDALDKSVDFYMMKPYSVDRVNHLIENAYFLSKRTENIVQATLIGSFTLSYKGQILKASNAKARELMALCLDHRGGIVTKEEAIDKLWPGREFNDNTKKLLNKAVNYIKDYMETRGIINFFYSTRAGCYINTEMVQCDCYEYVQKHGFDKVPVGYLEEFDWASKNY